jgi:glycosyltransferase involved in cell wall biosynthesis
VCIATYNQAPYIQDCVASVLAQAADADLEVLVGDDGSRDGTGDVLAALLERHPGRFTLIRRPGNIGGTENYQDLVRRAGGDFIAHLDGDDAWLPGKLRAQLEFLALHPQCVAVSTNAIAVDTQGVLLGAFSGRHPPLMPLGYVAGKGSYLMHSTLLYRAGHRALFTDAPPPVIDYALHLALAARGPIGYLNQALAVYRVATATSTVRNNYAFVQRLLWSAVQQAAAGLDADQRRDAGVHFAAEALIARGSGRGAPLRPLLDEIAAMAGCSRAQLVARALPSVIALGGVGVLRRVLRQAGANGLLSEHPRV